MKKENWMFIVCSFIVVFLASMAAAEPSELFLEILIPSKYARISSGEAVLVESDIILRGNEDDIAIVDVTIEYMVKDTFDSVVTKAVETKGGIFRLTTVRELEMPSAAKPGMYTVEVAARYKNLTSKNSAQFEIVKPPLIGFFTWQNHLKTGAAIIVTILVSIFLFGFWRLQSLAKKIEGKNEEKSKTALPYADYAVREYGKAGLVPLAGAETSSLVEKMTEYVHSFDYPQAVAHYHALQSHLEHSSKSGGKLQQVERLHKKLHLLLKINQFPSCTDNNDFLNLKYHLNEAAALYAQLLPGNIDEKHFLEKVKSAHDTFAKMALGEKREP